jgi:hypothetical protein
MSEKVRPGKEQAHVAVAALRVLAHLHSRPPSVQEVADLLGERPEPVNVVLRELTGLGIVREVTDAYGARYEVGDYLKIEELAEGSGPAMKTELASFSEKRRERDDVLRKQFEGDLKGQRERKFSKLEEDLKNFRGGSGPHTNLWGEPVKDEDDEA